MRLLVLLTPLCFPFPTTARVGKKALTRQLSLSLQLHYIVLSCTAKPHLSLSHSLGCVVQAMPSLLSSPRLCGTKSPAAPQLLKRPRRMTSILHGLDADAIIEPS